MIAGERMFSGIVGCGAIVEIRKTAMGLQLRIQSLWEDWQLGESVAVDGVCLTVVAFQGTTWVCDVSPETERLTRINDYYPGISVNLERALRFNDRIGGHWVLGHVDQTVHVSKQQAIDAFIEMHFQGVHASNQLFLVSKGSVAVNGVSLTVNRVWEGGFSVMLVPHTQQQTNLSTLQHQDRVNLELDWMARLIAQQCRHYFSKAPMESA